MASGTWSSNPVVSYMLAAAMFPRCADQMAQAVRERATRDPEFAVLARQSWPSALKEKSK